MIEDWPFKGKPITNAHTIIVLALILWVDWMLLMLVWPTPTFTVTMVICLFMCIRAVYRRIRTEW